MYYSNVLYSIPLSLKEAKFKQIYQPRFSYKSKYCVPINYKVLRNCVKHFKKSCTDKTEAGLINW